MDLLYHVFIFSAIFSHKVSELNSKNPFEANTKSNIDYNDLTAGVHFCYTGCTNSPGDYQRVICLRGQSNQNYDRVQVAYGVSTRKMSLRSMSNNVWTEWKTFSDDATFFAGTAIQSGDDLNDYTTPGIYRSTSSSITASLLNIPETFVSGFTMLVFNMATTTYVQAIFAGDRIYMRLSNTNGWLNWFKYSGTLISS